MTACNLRRAGFVPALALLGLLSLSILACSPTQVKLTPEGEKVAVAASFYQVRNCEPLGRITASSTNLDQDPETQRTINARNKAAQRGGNRIVGGQATLMTVGGGEFDGYRCP